MPPDKGFQGEPADRAGTALALRPEPALPLPSADPEQGRAERSRLLCDAAIDIASALFGVAECELRRGGRSPRHVTRVRQVAMYVAHTLLGLSQREVAIAFDRDRTTVVYACHAIEDLRDDQEFDRAVMLFETVLMAAFRARLEAPCP